jgi:hypothetical protein
MAYSEFLTLKQVEKKLSVKSDRIRMFSGSSKPQVELSIFLKNDLLEAEDTPLLSEKAKSEAVIAPILREVKRQNQHFSFFSGYTFDVDSNKSLVGICDFLLTLQANAIDIKAPVVCLVEAKNRAIDEGFGQCAAEMYAAKLYNDQEGENIDVIYGCVTNAYDWCFMKLENNVVYVDIDRYFLNRVDEIVGIFLHILEQYER